MNMKSATDIDRLADALLRAVEASDWDALTNLYAADAVIWHATDRTERRPADNIAFLARMAGVFPSVRYEDVRRQTYPGGYVQQHVMRVVRSDGVEFTFPACFVVEVDGDRIARIDEYFDSKQLPVAAGH